MSGMWWKDESDDEYVYDITKDDFVDYDHDISDYTPLFLAAHEGNLNRFNDLLDKSDLEKNIRQRTLMHVAAARGRAQIVDLLCQQNSLIDRRDAEGNSPLHLAIRQNHPEVFNVLLKRSNLNAKNFWDKRPLHFAAVDNRIQFTEMLLKNGANVNADDVDGKTPLFLALAGNHVELAELLLENGADVLVADLEGKTPLHLATEIKNVHFVEMFLKKGARVNALDEDKNVTPIEIAAEVGDIQLFEMFLNHGAKADQLVEAYKGQEKGTETTTALHFAAKVGNLEMIKLLMKNGFDTLEVENEKGYTPLKLAVTNNHLEVVKYLIENGSKILPENEDDYCLHEMCKTDEHLEVFKYLIDLGIKCKKNLRAHLLYCYRNLELWKYVLTRFSKIDANSFSIESELHSAVREGQVEIVKEIISKQTSKVKSDSQSSQLAVFIAVENKNEEILKILLEANYLVKSCFRNKVSPLHVAATFEDTRFVEMLLKAGANINSKGEHDLTPLDFAAAAGHSNMIKFFLDSGANTVKGSQNAYSSLHYVLERKPYKLEWITTPSMYHTLLKITEMMLITGASKSISKYRYRSLMSYAIKLRVSSEVEQSSSCFNSKEAPNGENVNKKKINERGQFRPEIFRCLVNYLEEDKLNDYLNLTIENDSSVLNSEIMDVILEYYDSKSHIKINHFLYNDYWSNVHIIDQSENVENLLNAARKHDPRFENSWTDILKMLTARLELLPSDQQLDKKKIDFYKKYNLLNWQNECQQQIKNMQITKLEDELNVTFYDILVESVDQVASYLRDEKLLNNFSRNFQKFPAYAEFLEIRAENGKQRNNLKDMCVTGMINLIEKNYNIQCSSKEIKKILQFLSLFDLRRLSAAIS